MLFLFCCLGNNNQRKNNPPPQKKENQLFSSVFFSLGLVLFGVPWLLFCCGCLLLFWLLLLLLLLLFVGFLFCFCCLGNNDIKNTHTTKNNKTPCFTVFRCCRYRSLATERPTAQEKKTCFTSCLWKAPFCRKKRLVLCCWHFLVFLVFFFCLISGSHFERRFRDHKTARPLFKLVLKVWNFDQNCAQNLAS